MIEIKKELRLVFHFSNVIRNENYDEDRPDLHPKLIDIRYKRLGGVHNTLSGPQEAPEGTILCKLIGISVVYLVDNILFLEEEVSRSPELVYDEFGEVYSPARIYNSYFDMLKMKEFETYLNQLWLKKGMLLLALRDNIKESNKDFLRTMVDMHKKYTKLAYIHCVIEKSEDHYLVALDALKERSNLKG